MEIVKTEFTYFWWTFYHRSGIFIYAIGVYLEIRKSFYSYIFDVFTSQIYSVLEVKLNSLIDEDQVGNLVKIKGVFIFAYL